MAHCDSPQQIEWSFPQEQPVVAPAQLHGRLDARRAGSAHVLRVDDGYVLYYWATDEHGYHRICMARSTGAEPHRWTPLGAVLERQPGVGYNEIGPGFPFVVARDDGPWLMYFGAWGQPRDDGKLANTTGIAMSDDSGHSWRYIQDTPVLPLDRPWDHQGTGSVCVYRQAGTWRMAYTSLGDYRPKPPGVATGHGDVIPTIGVGLAESADGITWSKPLDRLLVAPRGFATEPYEYIASKPFVLRRDGRWWMWVNTFGTAYRLRSLHSEDGLQWTWTDRGAGGDFGIGPAGAFDDQQRCYASVLADGDRLQCWYTGNGFGVTGIGYAVGRCRPSAEHSDIE